MNHIGLYMDIPPTYLDKILSPNIYLIWINLVVQQYLYLYWISIISGSI